MKSSVSESFLVPGEREPWLSHCEMGLANAGFKKVQTDRAAYQLRGNMKQLVGSIWGDIVITLRQEGLNTSVSTTATAKTDNVYALKTHPGGKMIERFKTALSQIPNIELAPHQSGGNSEVAGELEKLVALREQGHLDESEFKAAKARLLGSGGGPPGRSLRDGTVAATGGAGGFVAGGFYESGRDVDADGDVDGGIVDHFKDAFN